MPDNGASRHAELADSGLELPSAQNDGLGPVMPHLYAYRLAFLGLKHPQVAEDVSSGESVGDGSCEVCEFLWVPDESDHDCFGVRIVLHIDIRSPVSNPIDDWCDDCAILAELHESPSFWLNLLGVCSSY